MTLARTGNDPPVPALRTWFLGTVALGQRHTQALLLRDVPMSAGILMSTAASNDWTLRRVFPNRVESTLCGDASRAEWTSGSWSRIAPARQLVLPGYPTFFLRCHPSLQLHLLSDCDVLLHPRSLSNQFTASCRLMSRREWSSKRFNLLSFRQPKGPSFLKVEPCSDALRNHGYRCMFQTD